MISQEILIVQQWHRALNSDNKEQLAALVREDVRLGGPRGSIQGVDALLEWVDHAHITLNPQRYFRKNSLIGVEELGEWHNPETGEVTGNQQVITVFVVEDRLISHIIRYAGLQEAFEAFGLHEEHEVAVSH